MKIEYISLFLVSICFIFLGILVNHKLIDKAIHNNRIRVFLRVIKFFIVVSLIYLLVFSSNSVVKILATVSASFVMGMYSEPKKSKINSPK